MASGSTISMRYAHRILETAERAGVPREELLRAAPLQPVDRHGDLRIGGDAYYALWGAAMERVRDPSFPLRVAQSTGIETYEIFGFACMTSGSMREALHNAARYLHIWTDVASWELREGARQTTLALVPAPTRHPASRVAAECALAEVLVTSRGYLGTNWTPNEVHFPWRKPERVDHLTAFFGTKVVFERPFAALVFDSALLALPLVKADPAMARFFTAHAEQMLERFASPKDQSVVSDVRRLLAGSLQTGTPTLEHAAKSLALSTRTLRRRLQEKGHTFAELLQQTRCALAKQHLDEGRLSLSEIAFVLGFSDVRAFHRSFRRWTGVTPGAWREHAQKTG